MGLTSSLTKNKLPYRLCSSMKKPRFSSLETSSPACMRGTSVLYNLRYCLGKDTDEHHVRRLLFACPCHNDAMQISDHRVGSMTVNRQESAGQ